jgi:tetratricopeptide (TPR) repeat protein
MSKLPSRRRAWAIAYTLTLTAAAPLLYVPQSWSTPVTTQREGMIHLKRGQETVDVDSLLDTHQPDFFLRIEMNPPVPTPPPAALRTADPLESAERSAPAAATGSLAPSEPPLFAEEFMNPAATASVAPGARLQIVADALYRAPSLARQGRYREALEIVDAALGVDDAVAPLHALRGSLCFKLGREAQAEDGWARALELDPGLKDAREALDWIRNRRR